MQQTPHEVLSPAHTQGRGKQRLKAKATLSHRRVTLSSSCLSATSLTLSLFPPSPGPLYPLQRDQQGPGVLDRVERLKQGLLAKVRTLGRELPVNTLDQLIHQLGGPECVAEVSLAAHSQL